MARLTDCADEILLEINEYLDNTSLKKLALTARQFRGPAQGALCKNPVVGRGSSPEDPVDRMCHQASISILQFAQVLIKNPELGPKVRHLRFNIPFMEHKLMREARLIHIELFSKGKEILNNSIAKGSPAWFCAYDSGHLAAWVGIIWVLTNNLESLYINVEHGDEGFLLEIMYRTKDIDWTPVREEGLDVTFSRWGVN